MQFRVLGVVDAVSADQPVNLGHARLRCVLAVLLVEANRFVSVDQLMERVWGDCPPQRGRGVLYSYLSRLRTALSTEHEVTIERRSRGYMLTVDEASVDLHRFRSLITDARLANEDARALALFDQALLLWRGTPFADLDTHWLASVRAALEIERGLPNSTAPTLPFGAGSTPNSSLTSALERHSNHSTSASPAN